MATTTKTPSSSDHTGNCHCGAIRFSFTLTPTLYENTVPDCDCSICTRNGYQFVYPFDKDVTWHQGLDSMTVYKFGNQQIEHRFCPICGTSVTAKSTDPNFFFEHTAINVRTLKDVDFEKLKLKKFNGQERKPEYTI